MDLGLYRTTLRARERQVRDGLRGWHEIAQSVRDSELLFDPLVLPWILGPENSSGFS
jgi:hypothetical protein